MEKFHHSPEYKKSKSWSKKILIIIYVNMRHVCLSTIASIWIWWNIPLWSKKSLYCSKMQLQPDWTFKIHMTSLWEKHLFQPFWKFFINMKSRASSTNFFKKGYFILSSIWQLYQKTCGKTLRTIAEYAMYSLFERKLSGLTTSQSR